MMIDHSSPGKGRFATQLPLNHQPLDKCDTKPCSVIWIDDDYNYLCTGRIFLSSLGNVEVDIFSNPHEAIDLIQSRNYDVIITDYKMPVLNGIELLQKIQNSGKSIPSILLSCYQFSEFALNSEIPQNCIILNKGGDPFQLFYTLYKLIFFLKGEPTQICKQVPRKKSGIMDPSTVNQVVHDLRNNLQSLFLKIDTMQIRYAEEPDISKDLYDMARILDHMERIVYQDEETDLSGLDAFPSVRLSDLIQLVVTDTVPDTIEVIIQTGEVKIHADPLFQTIISNLVDNSLKHGKTVTRIEISLQRDENCCRLVYLDNGTGIPIEQKEILFSRNCSENSIGGLYLVREILSLNNASIRETGMPGKGARFEIDIPATLLIRE